MLKEGAYHGHLKSIQVGETPNGQNVQFVLLFSVGFIDIAGQWQDIPVVQRTIYLHCSDAAWPFTEKKLRALGFNGNFATPACSEEAYKNGIGLVCKHSEKQGGGMREEWDLADWGTREVKPASADKVNRLAALWRSGGATKPTGTPPAPPTQTKPSPTTQAKPPAAALPKTDGTTFVTKTHGEVKTSLESTLYGKDHAWAEFCASYEGEPDVNVWNLNVKSVSNDQGMHEADFGEDQWRRVVMLATLPI